MPLPGPFNDGRIVLMNETVKKIIKWIIVSITAFILLMIVGAFIFAKIVEQDSVKNRLTKFISHRIGRNVDISGSLQIKLFPTVTIHATGLSVDNPLGFKVERFIEAEKVTVRMKPLSLLAGKLSMDLSIKNLALQPFLASLLSPSLPGLTGQSHVANYNRLGGLANLNAELLLQRAVHKPFDNVNGIGKFMIVDGAYHGIDILYEVRRVHALLNGQPIPAKANSQLMLFSRLSMDFKIVDGVLSTNNFIVSAEDYGISGSGNANLVSQLLDFSLQASSNHDRNFLIPVKITGSFKEPVVKLDAALALQQLIKNTLQNSDIPGMLKGILR